MLTRYIRALVGLGNLIRFKNWYHFVIAGPKRAPMNKKRFRYKSRNTFSLELGWRKKPPHLHRMLVEQFAQTKEEKKVKKEKEELIYCSISKHYRKLNNRSNSPVFTKKNMAKNQAKFTHIMFPAFSFNCLLR